MKYLSISKSCYGLMAGVFLFAALLSSCIKDELPNAEADITKCIVTRDSALLIWKTDTVMEIGSSSQWNFIKIQIKKGSEVGFRAPQFEITPGATISPANGSLHDFSNEQAVTYTVTSQDGNWSRTYFVSYVEELSFPNIDPIFNFDIFDFNVDNDPKFSYKYYQIGERDADDEVYYWSSGNAGFLVARQTAGPYEYPTVPYMQGRTGRCAKLETVRTGSLGETLNMPKAAGNLFLGSFDADRALKLQHKEATRFGTPFARVPESLTGWYQYKAGETLTDRKGKALDGKDVFDIYAVFYENTDENGDPYMLDGTNVRSLPNPRIVAMTTFPLHERLEADEWTKFTHDFEYFKEVDPVRLLNKGYNISIVCSSSVDGADFIGAIGSTLLVDDFKINCK